MAMVEYLILAHSGLPNLPLSLHSLHDGAQPQTRHRNQSDCRAVDRGDPRETGRRFSDNVQLR